MKRLFKSFYNLIPFKKQLFSVVKLLWSPPKSVYRHLHFPGNMKVKVDDDHSFRMYSFGFSLENAVFWEGLQNGWEKQSVRLWVKLCSQSNVILDIGANTGIYSLVAKSVNPASEVYAFEPVQRVYEKLLRNVQLNNYAIKCYDKAISDSNGEAIIYDTNEEHVYSVTVNKNLAPESTAVFETKIQTITLEKFIRDNNISHIDLIKIDVETHEPEVLAGMGEYLRNWKPTMLIEILNDEVAARVASLIEGCNYLFYNIDENAGIRRTDKLTKSDYYNFLLCSAETAKSLGLD